MSFKANQLFILASNFEALTSQFLEKNAKDIEQPEDFGEDYHKWLKKNRKDSPTTVREMKAVKTPAPPQLVEVVEEVAEPEHEMTHEEWAEKNPRMSDWSDEDWSKYLKRSSAGDSNQAKDKKKLDPKAKVRNRGTVCVPASSAKDKKDHFPINDADQARNALARVHQYSSVPSWYSGSLKSLQELVSRKVHSKYKGIGKDKKKSSSTHALVAKYGNPVAELISKYGQASTQFPPALVTELQQSLNSIAGHPYLPLNGLMDSTTVSALQHFLMSGGRGVSWTPESTIPFANIVEDVKSWVGYKPKEQTPEPAKHHTKH
jgi:hypothetical protein